MELAELERRHMRDIQQRNYERWEQQQERLMEQQQENRRKNKLMEQEQKFRELQKRLREEDLKAIAADNEDDDNCHDLKTIYEEGVEKGQLQHFPSEIIKLFSSFLFPNDTFGAECASLYCKNKSDYCDKWSKLFHDKDMRVFTIPLCDNVLKNIQTLKTNESSSDNIFYTEFLNSSAAQYLPNHVLYTLVFENDLMLESDSVFENGNTYINMFMARCASFPFFWKEYGFIVVCLGHITVDMCFEFVPWETMLTEEEYRDIFKKTVNNCLLGHDSLTNLKLLKRFIKYSGCDNQDMEYYQDLWSCMFYCGLKAPDREFMLKCENNVALCKYVPWIHVENGLKKCKSIYSKRAYKEFVACVEHPGLLNHPEFIIRTTNDIYTLM